MPIKKGLVLLIGILSLIWPSACDQKQYPQGERIYEFYCSSCHMSDGSGLTTLYPALKDSEYIAGLRAELPCIIQEGRPGKILKTVYMPGNDDLTEAEMYNLINYLLTTWGDGSLFTLPELKKSMEACAGS